MHWITQKTFKLEKINTEANKDIKYIKNMYIKTKLLGYKDKRIL